MPLLFLKTLLFTVLVPGTVAGLAPRWIAAHGDVVSFSLGPARHAGWLLVLAGTLGYLWCAWNFVTEGRGTPAPIDAPRELVIRGPYRWSRNPMYVSVLLVVLGQAALLGSLAVLAYAIVVWACVQAFILFYEEPHLTRLFGERYERYRRDVPRWLGRVGD